MVWVVIHAERTTTPGSIIGLLYMSGLLSVLEFFVPIGENRRPREPQPTYDVPRVGVSAPGGHVLTRGTTIFRTRFAGELGVWKDL